MDVILTDVFSLPFILSMIAAKYLSATDGPKAYLEAKFRVKDRLQYKQYIL